MIYVQELVSFSMFRLEENTRESTELFVLSSNVVLKAPCLGGTLRYDAFSLKSTKIIFENPNNWKPHY